MWKGSQGVVRKVELRFLNACVAGFGEDVCLRRAASDSGQPVKCHKILETVPGETGGNVVIRRAGYQDNLPFALEKSAPTGRTPRRSAIETRLASESACIFSIVRAR